MKMVRSPPPVRGAPRLPSLRVSAALAAGMLALGVAVGAAIGPGVGGADSALAGERIPLLLPAIAAIAGGGVHTTGTSTAAAVQPPPVTPQPTPSSSPGAGSSSAATKTSKTAPSAATTPAPTPSAAKTPTKSTPKSSTQTLPPVTSVWLITLSGGTFAQALAQPSTTPYIDSQLVPAGTLLSGWSSLDAGAFASEAGLLGGVPPQTLDSIVQPPCPASSPEGEGAAGAACAPETAGALTAADEFLKATLSAITASAAYRAHGLIVITFGSVGNATASSLPAGSSTVTLSSEPPVGVLLLSPFARAGARPATPFNPTSPKQSLSGLLH
jgi:hypothetical protein